MRSRYMLHLGVICFKFSPVNTACSACDCWDMLIICCRSCRCRR